MRIVAILPYRSAYNSVVGRLHEPVIKVTLSHGHQELRQSMLLDSGSDISLIPATLGTALGLDRNTTARARARGLIIERTPLRIVEVNIQIGESMVVPIRAGLLEDDDVPPLLGRLDLFDSFTFEFNHERRMVIVRQ